MQTFKDYKYERPDVEALKASLERIIKGISESKSADEQENFINEFNKEKAHMESMYTVAHIRHDINANDEFYDKENEFWNEFMPVFSGYSARYATALLESKFRKNLEAKFGKHLFDLYELEKKVFDDSIKEDMVLENKLASEYGKLVANGKVMFRGKEITLNDITPFRQDKDREVRKEANEAYTSYFSEHMDDFDRIYDELVKVRTKMAKKLGYENYIQMAYDKMARTDYNALDVKGYREQIKEVVVPMASALMEKQKARLGLDTMYFYDNSLKFLSGNPTPKGDPDWIMANGDKMYAELGGELKTFFEFMRSRELFDVLSREGKRAGGYCTFMEDFDSPFIFANFNGTAHDVDVLTHEAGHAFQVYSASKEQTVPEYLWPTMEAAEIHSMSMEFITWPWMKLFFEEDETKYKYNHLSGAVEFLPYGATVDEFQHIIYENPDMTPEERRKVFRDTEKKYLPHINYGDNDFLESGGFFFRQGHIFSIPFYYIDYTLAQVCALQFWTKSRNDREKTMEVYNRLCKAGGSRGFLGLLEVGELKNPFIDGTIAETMKPVQEYLDSVDDSKL